MNKGKIIQQKFFDSIRQRLPHHLSLVNEVAELLEISYDSAYRRLRGDKDLSIEEIKILSARFNLSVDSLFGQNNADIIFQPFRLRLEENGFEEWLRMRSLEIFRYSEARNKELIMIARDLPIFFFFDFPELAAFKIYFWKKMLLHFPDYHDKKFNIREISDKLQELGSQVLTSYTKVPSTEIWCQETFTRIMQQIEFCRVSGLFMNKNDADTLFCQLETMIRHLQNQTEQGHKFRYGKEGT